MTCPDYFAHCDCQPCETRQSETVARYTTEPAFENLYVVDLLGVVNGSGMPSILAGPYSTKVDAQAGQGRMMDKYGDIHGFMTDLATPYSL